MNRNQGFLEKKRGDLFILDSSGHPTTKLDSIRLEIETTLSVEEFAVTTIGSASQPEVSA